MAPTAGPPWKRQAHRMRTELRTGLSEAHTPLRAFLAHSWSRRRRPAWEPPKPRGASTDGPRSPWEGRGLWHAGSAKPRGRAQRRPKGVGPAQGRRQCPSGLPACLLRLAPGTAGCRMAGRVVGTPSTTGSPWLRKGRHWCWGGGHLARPGKTPRPSPTGPTAPQEHTLLPGLPALQFFPLPRASRNLPGSFPHTWALVGVSQGRLLLLAGPYQMHVRLESDVDGTPVSRAGDSSRDR